MGFNQLIIGFIFIFFNINLINVNVLPDFIGYIFFYLGATSLVNSLSSEYFTFVKNSSRLLIILSIIESFIDYSSILNNVLNDVQALHEKIFALIFTLTITTLYLFCVYYLFKGIEHEAIKIEDTTLQIKSKKTLKLMMFYNVIGIIPFLGILFYGNSEINISFAAGPLFFIVFLIGMFYVFVKLIRFLKYANLVLYKDNQ
ncbi:hypothetical protein [Gottfriedia solisilvae]|uniref:Uncharacterized protein n=1 Tax=Gottfriedia solisilvae TaxID=1516104 RepID=A0A8J3ANR6_9BACI|nr:hypothetical protein [Gottfriedia solisilvae]GGI17243.1 hypothetical protein GCM10007380_36970 [Gottfriedia solisilvae]